MTDRLFVPLNSEWYYAFEDGTKDVELRGVNSRFNTDHVFTGRDVELRRGYSTGDSIWGSIGEVWEFKDIDTIPERMDHRRITPEKDRDEFVSGAKDLLTDYSAYIAFEVKQ